ncbi:MAG: hypothetical protein JWN40_6031 [Phycisphaerales bacterium]|nr:hypothetical protein [Phycisphaerales bacterium]
MSSESSNTLHYAPRPPLFRRRRFRRGLTLLLLLTAAAWSAWQWGPPLYFRARTYIWRNQAFSYTLPPETVVFESDPVASVALFKQSGYLPLTLGVGQPPGAARNLPACRWLMRMEVGSEPDPEPDGQIFLHRLTTRGGQSEVVAVQFFVNRFPIQDKVIDPPVGLAVYAFVPELDGSGADANFRRAWQQRPFTAECYGLWNALNDRSLRFYAGQPDPSDPSHFTIGYSAHGQRGAIDGWAEDGVGSGGLFGSARDEERHWHIRLVVRDGPAKGGVTIENAGDRFEALYDKDPLDQTAEYLVGGRVTDFGRTANPRAEHSLVWRMQITHVYSGRKDLLGKSFGAMGDLAAYRGHDVPPVLRVGEEGIWWVKRMVRDTPDETIWADYGGEGTTRAEGRTLYNQEYPAVVEWAQAVERVESAPAAQRSVLLRELSNHPNARIAEWATEALPRR